MHWDVRDGHCDFVSCTTLLYAPKKRTKNKIKFKNGVQTVDNDTGCMHVSKAKEYFIMEKS